MVVRRQPLLHKAPIAPNRCAARVEQVPMAADVFQDSFITSAKADATLVLVVVLSYTQGRRRLDH